MIKQDIFGSMLAQIIGQQEPVVETQATQVQKAEIAPLSAGLWMAAFGGKRETTAELNARMVAQAEEHLRELFKTPYYHEALARLTKDGEFKLDSRLLNKEKGVLAGGWQWPEPKQPLGMRHLNFRRERKYSGIDDVMWVFIFEMAKAAALETGEKISGAEALIRILKRHLPKMRDAEVNRKVRNQLAPRISKTRGKLSKDQIDVINKSASSKWRGLY